VLMRPDWLFLDEATSAMDDASEQRAYALLESRLPDTAMISIAHRAGAAGFHGRRLTFQPDGERMRLAPA